LIMFAPASVKVKAVFPELKPVPMNCIVSPPVPVFGVSVRVG